LIDYQKVSLLNQLINQTQFMQLTSQLNRHLLVQCSV
jgi:hypothetical protein